MGLNDTITDEEMAAVEEFRKLVIQDCSPKLLEDDYVFYRFMKARDFNLKDAQEMFQKHLSFRKEYRIDTIVTDYKPPEALEKYCPVSFLGYDKEGDAIVYLDLGRCDAIGFVRCCKKLDIIKYNLQLYEIYIERIREHSKQLGINARKMGFILNFDDLSLANATSKKALDILVLGAKLMQDNCPETIKHLTIINGSFYFTWVYAILKPFLSLGLQQKIRIFNSGYQDTLLELIEAEVLPAFLGGKRTDPDGNPNCYSQTRWGVVLPEKYRMCKSERRLATSPCVQRLTVTRFAKSDIRFDVPDPGSLLEWEFETKNRDIGFGVYFKGSSEEGSKPVELVPKQRIETDIEPETGVYKCTNPGTYIIVFDNSYSWIFSKEVFYRVRIVGPQDEQTDAWT